MGFDFILKHPECPAPTHTSFTTTADPENEHFVNSKANIEWNENSRTSEVNELPQMCFPHGVSSSSRTLMIGIYSLKERANSTVRWLASRDECRPHKLSAARASSAGCKTWGEIALNSQNRNVAPRTFRVFLSFAASLRLCLPRSTQSSSLSLFAVSSPLCSRGKSLMATVA